MKEPEENKLKDLEDKVSFMKTMGVVGIIMGFVKTVNPEHPISLETFEKFYNNSSFSPTYLIELGRNLLNNVFSYIGAGYLVDSGFIGLRNFFKKKGDNK